MPELADKDSVGRGSKKKPAPEKPDWKILEEVVAKIQRYLVPGAEVRHDHRVQGRSGRVRQLDVTVSQRIGGVPVFIVFECKRRRNEKPVPMKEVEAFATKLKDVRAKLGVMVSKTGFDAGAKAIADQENIALRTFREADETDWGKLMGKGAWLTFHVPDLVFHRALVTLKGEHAPDRVPFELAIYDREGKNFGDIKDQTFTLKKLFWESWPRLERPRPIGMIELNLDEAKPAAFVKKDGALAEVETFLVTGKMLVRKYVYSFEFAEGKSLEDNETKLPDYVELTTKGFNIERITKSQEGVELTQEEWNEVEMTARGELEMGPDIMHRITFIGEATPPKRSSTLVSTPTIEGVPGRIPKPPSSSNPTDDDA